MNLSTRQIKSADIKKLNSEPKMALEINLSQIPIRKFIKIPLPTKNGLDFVLTADILYGKSEGNYVRIYTIQGKPILISLMISEFEKLVSEHFFVRIHHQYIINLQHLERYEKGDGGLVLLVQNISLPVSRERKKMFLNKVLGCPL